MWMVDTKASFDQTAEEDSQSANLLSYVEMTVEGAFTRVICLITDWPIPSTPSKIRLRWESHPVAQFSWFTSVAHVHCKGSHPCEVTLCGLVDENE